jgi:hypothetical protein
MIFWNTIEEYRPSIFEKVIHKSKLLKEKSEHKKKELMAVKLHSIKNHSIVKNNNTSKELCPHRSPLLGKIKNNHKFRRVVKC